MTYCFSYRNWLAAERILRGKPISWVRETCIKALKNWEKYVVHYEVFEEKHFKKKRKQKKENKRRINLLLENIQISKLFFLWLMFDLKKIFLTGFQVFFWHFWNENKLIYLANLNWMATSHGSAANLWSEDDIYVLETAFYHFWQYF